jgi:hypothetical protein
MSEIDSLDTSCKNCPLLTPGLVAFMRTMSLEVMSGEIEDAEQQHVLAAMVEQAGDAIDVFVNELDDEADFSTFINEAQKRFGPLMTAAIDQAHATFSSQRVELSDRILDTKPGRLVCSGTVTLGERTFCGAVILSASSQEGHEEQAIFQGLNEDFVERAINP